MIPKIELLGQYGYLNGTATSHCLEKLFGINPLVKIHSEGKYNFWHIGRFVINKESAISTVSLFKQLMLFAVHPIVSDQRSYMIAKSDSKLLRVMNALGIKTRTLDRSIYTLHQRQYLYVPVEEVFYLSTCITTVF